MLINFPAPVFGFLISNPASQKKENYREVPGHISSSEKAFKDKV
jgi:hypothetical protein